MGIVESIFSRRSKRKEPAIAAFASGETATKLMMLMPDASGIATYKLHTFVSAGQAETYLASILRGDIQEGTIMFWGLTWEPSANGNQGVEAEPVVLIRDARRPGLVYTFSFTDIDSANDFVRHEMKAGLDLDQTAIFWAAPAQATANHWGEITVAPSQPPSRQLATDSGAAFAAPEPLAAPEHDEPSETELPIDQSPPVRLPETVPAEQEAAAEPEEAIAEPEDVAEPKAIDDPQPADESAPKPAGDAGVISKVIGIFAARDRRAPDSSPPPSDEPDTAEDAPADPSDAGDETMQVDLSDVFGRGSDPEWGAWTSSEDFRSRQGRETNGLDAVIDAAEEKLSEAPGELASAIVTAWSNIAAGLDEAMDAYVARRVTATMSWRRLTRSLAAAARLRMVITWRIISRALAAGAAIQVRRDNALAEVWRNAARAIYRAAETKSGRRALRLVWANISWTLEEAVFAARLQQKRTTGRVWFNAASALASAAHREDSIQRGIRTSWNRLTVGALDAAHAAEQQRASAVVAWAATGEALADAVEAMRRHECVVLAWTNTGIALNEYTSAKLAHDGLVSAWTRLASAIEEAAAVAARHNRISRVWTLLAIETLVAADLQIRRDASIAAWDAIAIACVAAVAAKTYRDRCIAIWDTVAVAIAAALPLWRVELGAIQAWHNAMLALSEAAVAEAQMVIAQADLNSRRMERVNSVVLKAKSGASCRFSQKKDPFSGFGSPPGRF